MTIYEQIKEALDGKKGKIVTSTEVKNTLIENYSANPDSIIISDYCYNRINSGISFNKHLFQYINRNSYKYLGEEYPYTGYIYHKRKGYDSEVIVGEWKNGAKIMYDVPIESLVDNSEIVGKEQLAKLYEDYCEMLRIEMNLLKCKPTEVRHLIGRIGEFYCALYTNGQLAKETNQHGFDVISKGRKISVKTTAQKDGFVTINKNTFDYFDDFFVVQYMDDEFKVLYYGPKDEILKIKRDYGSKYEVDLKKLGHL